MRIPNPALRFLSNHVRNRLVSTGAKVPTYGYITLETVCNSRCNYCNMWETKKGDQPSTEEWKTIIEDIAALGAVTLTFSGGEPFLNRDLFELAAFARAQGLITMVVTNLSKFQNDWVAKVDESFDFFGTSIDSTRPEVYLDTRGVDWLERNQRNIRVLMAGLAERKSPTTVCAMVTVSNRNAYEIHEIQHMVFDELGMDAISFNLLDPQGSPTARQYVPTPDQVAFYRQVVLDHKGLFPISNSRRYLEQAGNFDYACNPWKSIQIDHEGTLIAPCLFIDGGRFNLRQTPLREVWKAKGTQAIYEQFSDCKTCNLGCVVESSWSTTDLGFTLNESFRGMVLPTFQRVRARNRGRVEKSACTLTYPHREYTPSESDEVPLPMVSRSTRRTLVPVTTGGGATSGPAELPSAKR
jgi:MoaA/NifB/PqqE/SkfB family radical SAM enzyme